VSAADDVAVAILCGGRATRLGALAAHLPLEHQLALLRSHGLRRVVLCAGHLADEIVAHVGDGRRFGVHVEYSLDGPMALGTGGALRRALPSLGSVCWVLYGDSYLELDYPAVLAHFRRRPEPALMTVYRNEGRWDTSNVLYQRGRVARYDKRRPSPGMAHIDYGASLLRTRLLEPFQDGEAFDLADLFGALAEAGQLAGYEAQRRFFEIGSPGGLAEADRYLSAVAAAAGSAHA
jgi:NDP-sugar pyrophosphorylase family protein